MSGFDQPLTLGTQRHTVFLSYSRADQPYARKVLGLLQAAGISVWWDAMLEGGAQYNPVTEQKLEAADAVVVLWSQVSVGSHWVHDEATRGRELGTLIPVSIDGSQPPLGFRQFHWISLPTDADWTSETPEIKRLVSAIVAKQAGPGAAPAPSEDRSALPDKTAAQATPVTGFSRRRAIIGGAALAAGAGGLAIWKTGLFNSGGNAIKLAVMPFDVVGETGEAAYLLDGFATEIRSQLARNPLLHVAAKTSSDALRESGETASAICSKLGVNYLLTGEIRSNGDSLAGGAELVEGSTDRVLREFDISGRVDSIFAIQSQIASGIVTLLAGADERSAPSQLSGGTSSVAAYDAFLRGQALYEAGIDEASDRAALAKFEEAIRFDPDYAAAHAKRGRTLALIQSLYGAPQERDSALKAAAVAAERATAIAPDFADGYAALGFILASGKLDMKGARAPWERAYALGKGDSDLLSRYAIFRSRIGDDSGAMTAISTAQAIDPLNARVFRFSGEIAYLSGQYGSAIAQFEKGFWLQAGLSSYNYVVGLAQLGKGDLAGAKTSFEAETRSVFRQTGLAIVEHKLGNTAVAQQHLTELKANQGDKSHYQYAQVHAQWGEEAEALEALASAWQARDAGLAQLYRDPLLQPLRATDGYRKAVAAMGFV